MIEPPKIDPRLTADVADETRRFLVAYLGPSYGWNANDDGGEVGRALTQVFSYYCSVIIDRLNRAPEKNYLAFLDLLGNSRVPAEAARAPITFTVDKAVTVQPSLLPAGTKVQAAAPPGGEAITFETDRDLSLSTVSLVQIRRGVTVLSSLIDNVSGADSVFASLDPYLFGLTAQGGQPLTQTIEMFFFLDAPEYTPSAAGFTTPPPPLRWERATVPTGPWQRLLVEDETESLTRSGTVRFRTPGAGGWDAAATSWLWIRANPPSAAYQPRPVLRGVALNTVPATQATTIIEEVLGSSNGNAGQTFSTTRTPIQPGQVLQVRELREWVGWTEVPDFHGSTPLDRHYLLDHHKGVVRFSDGVRGMIPPPGARNVRMAVYRAGGGVAGNVAAHALSALVSGVKSVLSVTNLVAAGGGADVEDQAAMVARASNVLRHRQRAVTKEDYEDLSRMASMDVARALCVPLQDLGAEPYKKLASADVAAGVGKVSVIVVPRSTAPKPLPSGVLMRIVRAYLTERASGQVAISVVGPLYLRVNVSVTIRLRSVLYADRIERQVQDAFAAFLHPLTGGSGGTGWPFGREPNASDFYQLVGGIDGVSYVSALTVVTQADDITQTAAIKDTGRYLVYSGSHAVTFDN